MQLCSAASFPAPSRFCQRPPSSIVEPTRVDPRCGSRPPEHSVSRCCEFSRVVQQLTQQRHHTSSAVRRRQALPVCATRVARAPDPNSRARLRNPSCTRTRLEQPRPSLKPKSHVHPTRTAAPVSAKQVTRVPNPNSHTHLCNLNRTRKSALASISRAVRVELRPCLLSTEPYLPIAVSRVYHQPNRQAFFSHKPILGFSPVLVS